MHLHSFLLAVFLSLYGQISLNIKDNRLDKISKYDNIEIVSCNILDNLKSGIVFVNGIKMLNITGGEIAANGEYGIELNGECRFFNITPMIVRNSQHGIHINNSIYYGFINNVVIANNTVGIYKASGANLYGVHIGELVYSGNTTDNNLTE